MKRVVGVLMAGSMLLACGAPENGDLASTSEKIESNGYFFEYGEPLYTSNRMVVFTHLEGDRLTIYGVDVENSTVKYRLFASPNDYDLVTATIARSQNPLTCNVGMGVLNPPPVPPSCGSVRCEPTGNEALVQRAAATAAWNCAR